MYLQVAQLKEEVSELEALQEVHEQLVESNHELEQDLREELDMAHAATREVSLPLRTFSVSQHTLLVLLTLLTHSFALCRP